MLHFLETLFISFHSFSLILPSHFISLSWSSICDILSSAWLICYWNLCMLHKGLVLCFSHPLSHLYSSLSCLFSLAFCQTFFQGSSFLCVGLENVLLAQRSLLLPSFWSLFLSIHWIPFLSSFVPLLVISCDPLEEERHSAFRCFHPFCSVFFPSLWIYLPVVFVVRDFWLGSLSGHPFSWWWSNFFLFFSFHSNRPLCCRTAGGPLQILLDWGSPAVSTEQ